MTREQAIVWAKALEDEYDLQLMRAKYGDSTADAKADRLHASLLSIRDLYPDVTLADIYSGGK